MSMSVADIKKIYSESIDHGIMDYDKELQALDTFIKEYEADQRGGVQNIVKSAGKRYENNKDKRLR